MINVSNGANVDVRLGAIVGTSGETAQNDAAVALRHTTTHRHY